jgi:hypothetical protein
MELLKDVEQAGLENAELIQKCGELNLKLHKMSNQQN